MNKCLDNDIIPLVVIWDNGIPDSRIEVNKIINSDCHLRISDIVSNENWVKQDINGIPAITGSDMFYLLNGRLVSGDSILADVADTNIVNKLECIARMKGGFDLEDIPIIGQVFSIFKPIISPIVGIGNVFLFLFQLVIWFGKFVYWSIFFIAWMFTDLLNPIKLVADFWNSIVLILVTIVNVVIGVAMGIVAFIVNQVGQWMQSIWGWDQSSLTKVDKESNYFKGIDMNKGKKCYLTNNGKVPFSILLGTVLCPPIGVFMDLGITGWMNILICALLTLAFYVPGLFYALLVIYS